ncbi:fimbrial protein [Citrobacter koseri]|uniref:fimbrial protein n=1 Tax=Citrobacter koseri TaxID=545 RepID=UPI000DF9774C|nr:fimbrial protein [Citrobacter koseri]STB73304.1 putative fimbrial protein StaE [Citrobacter koseri]STT23483.1 putative fimbrial protein StaE [Citrobacter koseri]
MTMATEHTERSRGCHGWLAVLSGCAVWLLCLALPARAADGDSVLLTLNYTVIQGTCVVDVVAGSGNTLDFGDVAAKVKTTAWAPMSLSSGVSMTFSVGLSSCNGAPNANMTPALTMDGATLTEDGTDNSSYLFVNSGQSTAQGLGVVVYNSGTPKPGSNEVAAFNSAAPDNRKYISIPGYGKGTAPNGNVNVPLSAAVTCGATCVTKPQDMRAGTLKGSVTFNFVYH